jgi:hypothetical protein
MTFFYEARFWARIAPEYLHEGQLEGPLLVVRVVGSIGDRSVAFGAGERSEHRVLRDVVGACAGDAPILSYNRAVANALSASCKPFSRILEKIKPVMELALYKDSLATIDFGGGQKFAARVRMDAQKVRYPVRGVGG